jgi:catechol 2,3-dioxygenase-like lactoylglutathione lyase family enzyme
MHLAADNRAAALDWYMTHLDAKPHPSGDRVLISDVMLVFFERTGSPRSEGSAVDHFGVSFPDIEAKMRAFEAASVKVLAPIRDVPGLFKFAFIEDPWGTKIEVVQDTETLGFHHVHVNVPDPAKTFAWYAEHLGGEPASPKDVSTGCVSVTSGSWRGRSMGRLPAVAPQSITWVGKSTTALRRLPNSRARG